MVPRRKGQNHIDYKSFEDNGERRAPGSTGERTTNHFENTRRKQKPYMSNLMIKIMFKYLISFRKIKLNFTKIIIVVIIIVVVIMVMVMEMAQMAVGANIY